jgi:hypothetical protein
MTMQYAVMIRSLVGRMRWSPETTVDIFFQKICGSHSIVTHVLDIDSRVGGSNVALDGDGGGAGPVLKGNDGLLDELEV